MGILPFGNSFHLCSLYASEKSIWYHSELHLFFQRLLLLIDIIIVIRMLSHYLQPRFLVHSF